MKQAALNLNLSLKKTRKREFMEQMEQVVPWVTLVELIAPYYPKGRTRRPPFSLQTMLRFRHRLKNTSCGLVKVRYCGLKMNTVQLFTLFALSNLWMVRGRLMEAGA